MKKKIGIILVMLVASVMLLAACGGKSPSVNSIKAEFEDAGYTTAGITAVGAETFTATKGTVSVTVYKWNNETSANLSASAGRLTPYTSVSQKSDVYVCVATAMSETDRNAAIAIFDGCF